MYTHDACGKYLLAGAVALAALASLGTAHAGFTVLYTFSGGNDGANPEASLIEDSAGNLYGTTLAGGGYTSCGFSNGCGTVFKLAPDGTETVLHAFTGGSDGAEPQGRVIEDSAGNLYGTTYAGGSQGYGTVFKLAPDGTETVLHAFTSGSDGAYPVAGLTKDLLGNLYGTTAYGGGGYRHQGHGTVFKIAPDSTETVLLNFSDSPGKIAIGGLIKDKANNLYGTTEEGGNSNCDRPNGCGLVFKLAPGGSESVLHRFKGGSDGAIPWASLIKDQAGNLYGTTGYGGDANYGTVFKLAPDGTETVLYAFTGGTDGAKPESSLIRDKVGNLYSVTRWGGDAGCLQSLGCGTVFRLAPDGTLTVLYTFTGGNDGGNPFGALIKNKAGNFYGTAFSGGGTGCGGSGCGTVFELTK